jgi:hypothetical protein
MLAKAGTLTMVGLPGSAPAGMPTKVGIPITAGTPVTVERPETVGKQHKSKGRVTATPTP